jgi:response regulator RpfG family c-di-GMP phosphodiesterase
MRVLVVDDSSTNLMLLSQLVRRIDCTALPYADPLQALADVVGLEIDLAIVDYKMPHLNGIELVSKLRAIPSLHDLPMVMITTSDETSVRYAALEAGVTEFLKKPIDPVEVKARLKNLLRLREAQNKLKNHAAMLASEVRKATAALATREEEIIHRLSRAAEYRDTHTGVHIVRMASYCKLIAESMALNEDLCRTIYLAAPMHDVGKIGVSDAILLKPGKLTQEERSSMEEHTVNGQKILSGSDSDLINAAAEIALCHHERWDGTGYPAGLRGEAIPLFARIAAVADVFDALTSERPYKPAWSPEDARTYIHAGAGQHFDPACVSAFFGRWTDVLAICARTSPTANAQLPNLA